MKDGRSAPPPPPECVQLELTCAAINKFLGTHYTPQEIDAMPETWLIKMAMLING